jgi:hypothetical protein
MADSAADVLLADGPRPPARKKRKILKIPSGAEAERRLIATAERARAAAAHAWPPPHIAEAKSARERAIVRDRVMQQTLPAALDDACDYETLMDALTSFVEYIDSVFAAATCRPFADGVVPQPIDDGRGEEKRLADDMKLIADKVAMFWMDHADEMLSETDMSADDACPDRIPIDVVCMWVIALAEATSLSLGEYSAYDDVTALSFPSVRRQKLAQTRRKISEYGPSDLARAMDAVSHNWHRIDVDEDVFAYVNALRIRYGMLLRCGVTGEWPPADLRLLSSPGVLATGVAARLPTIAFREEMTYRLRPFLDASWIKMLHPNFWTYEELRRAIDDKRRTDAEPVRMTDPERTAKEVMTLIRDYAKIVRGGGNVSEHVQKCYLDFMIGPGDYEVYHARNPINALAPKNVVKIMRSNKFLSVAMLKSIEEPDDVLTEGLSALGDGRGRGGINRRSRVRIDDEIVGTCAFDALMKGRYGVPWRERFTVNRRTYRIASDLGLLNAALPMVIVWTNKYDILWQGRIYRTSSEFETIAWWIEIVRVAHGGELPACVTKFKGMLAAKKDPGLQMQAQLEDEEEQEDDEEEVTHNDRVARITKQMRRSATRKNLKDLCEVTGESGAAGVNLKPADNCESCTVAAGTDVVSF